LLAVVRLEREVLSHRNWVILPPMGTLNLPARDARGGKLCCTVCGRWTSSRRESSPPSRHAGELVERRGLTDELALEHLPLVSRLFGDNQDRR